MSKKIKSVVSDNSSSRTVMVNFHIALDERLLDNVGDTPLSEVLEHSDLLDPEQAVELVDIDKELHFRSAIESKARAEGVTLEFAGKNEDGEDVYRVA